MKPTNPQDCCNEIVDLLQDYVRRIDRANKPDDYPIETRHDHATGADIEKLREHRRRHYRVAQKSKRIGGLFARKSRIYKHTTELIKATPSHFKTKADDICRDLKEIVEYGFFMLYPLRPIEPPLPLNDTVFGDWQNRVACICQTILEFRDNYLAPDVDGKAKPKSSRNGRQTRHHGKLAPSENDLWKLLEDGTKSQRDIANDLKTTESSISNRKKNLEGKLRAKGIYCNWFTGPKPKRRRSVNHSKTQPLHCNDRRSDTK